MVENGDKEASERRRSRIVAYSAITLVLAISVILTAPMTTCSSYRKRTIKAAPLSDLRRAAGCQEMYYAENEIYADSVAIFAGDCSNFQPNLNLVIYVVSADKCHYKMAAYHEKGKHLYEMIGGPYNPIIIRYDWKNQEKGEGKVM